MMTLAAFLVAIFILVAVHEWGHFQMARTCGVRVLRFAIGFGPVLFSWTSKRTGTEYALAAIPFGGYVRMLDGREGEVPPDQLHMAFNTQVLWKRAAIVFAGPLANLTLAVLLYSVLNWVGMMEPQAKISSPLPQSLAAKVGLAGGETVLQVAVADEAPIAVASFETLRWWMAKAALQGQDLQLFYTRPGQEEIQSTQLPLSTVDASHADATLFRAIGITSPYSIAVLGEVVADSAAQRAGLRPGDVVLRVGNLAIADAAQLREWIRSTGVAGAPAATPWLIQRGTEALEILVQPRRELQSGSYVGRIGAVVGAAPAMVLVDFGVVEGVQRALVRTWEISSLTVRMFGQMLIGQASLKNISGPLTIADYAGKSAGMGLREFMVFLALVSVSLGVINLLPLPVLDGGHLMYYLWETLTGKAVTDRWLDVLQKFGIAVLLLLMSIAVFNDISRLIA